MTVSYWQQAHRSRRASYDVAVVGGGIAGCSAAYWLRRQRPSLDVAIVEARSLGAGASGRNAGFILQGTSRDFRSDVERYGPQTARRLWRFTRANRDLIMSELSGAAFGWRSDGSVTAAGDEAENDRLRQSLSHLRAAGAPVVHLSPDQVNERLHSTGFRGGLFVTSGAVVDPVQLVRHVAEASGADLRTHQPVEAIHWGQEDGVTLDTPDRRLWARQVVLALGPSLPSLAPGLAPYVRSVRAQMLATAPAEQVRLPVPVYSHEGGFYVRQLQSGVVLAGGGRHHHREAESTAADRTTPAVQATLERYLHEHFPWTQSLPIRQRWSGTMGFSPDGRPVVGSVPQQPGSVFVTGFTGHGMGYGFRMGRVLADLVCGGQPDALDLFTAARFDETEHPEARQSFIESHS